MITNPAVLKELISFDKNSDTPVYLQITNSSRPSRTIFESFCRRSETISSTRHLITKEFSKEFSSCQLARKVKKRLKAVY